MIERFFNLSYCFDRSEVRERIDELLKKDECSYICVADGVVLNIVNRDVDYQRVTDGAVFSICDSSFVPLYIKWIYGLRREQYCGSEIFKDIVSSRKYRMIFMGTSQNTLNSLQKNLTEHFNPDCADMTFYELPFKNVEDFDYPDIAKMIENDGADIIWVALGAPKQERFMNLLQPYLQRGVMIAVGAAFKFYSGIDEKRAPEWMVKHHMEFIYRIYQDPKKQLKRCFGIIAMLPVMFFQEFRRKYTQEKN